MPAYYLGFDPDGVAAFGWAVAAHHPGAVPAIVASGCEDNAKRAVDAAYGALSAGVSPDAAGIDAPLFWTSTGVRDVDAIVRREIKARGAATPGGTVQSLNSLRGACLVQGVTAAIRLRQLTPAIRLTETHPKALRWRLAVASRARGPNAVTAEHLAAWVAAAPAVATEHARDAVLSCIAAGAYFRCEAGWHDLVDLEPERLNLVPGGVGYWMPKVSGS